MGKRTRTRSNTSAKKSATARKKREPKRNVTGDYKGIAFDSLEELAILQWLFELKAAGYIKSIQRAESYLLCDSLVNNYAEQLKTSSRPKTQTLLHGHSYTPEFIVTWYNKKGIEKFVWDINRSTKFDSLFIGVPEPVGNEYVTYIEVKPTFDQNNMERLFKINQKWMWEKAKIFVNLLKVNDLFTKTFTPKEYLVTPSGRPRKINWKVKSLFNYINS